MKAKLTTDSKRRDISFRLVSKISRGWKSDNLEERWMTLTSNWVTLDEWLWAKWLLIIVTRAAITGRHGGGFKTPWGWKFDLRKHPHASRNWKTPPKPTNTAHKVITHNFVTTNCSTAITSTKNGEKAEEIIEIDAAMKRNFRNFPRGLWEHWEHKFCKLANERILIA